MKDKRYTNNKCTQLCAPLCEKEKIILLICYDDKGKHEMGQYKCTFLWQRQYCFSVYINIHFDILLKMGSWICAKHNMHENFIDKIQDSYCQMTEWYFAQ